MKLPTERLKAKRSLGQNFLSDANFIRKIVDAVAAGPGDTVIEIGPGRAALTVPLVQTGAKVIAIELDRNLIEPLRERFSGRPNFRVVEQDALEVDFGSLTTQPAKVAANLPYYISTAILQRLAAQRQHFSDLVLMFQKEVVDRITAKPGSSERGYLTVLIESAFRVQKLFDVPPNAFQPPPKVTSAVVRLTPVWPAIENEESFRDLLSVAFAQKRKTILNNLKSRYKNATEVLDRAGIDSTRRAESLAFDEWVRLHNAVAED